MDNLKEIRKPRGTPIGSPRQISVYRPNYLSDPDFRKQNPKAV